MSSLFKILFVTTPERVQSERFKSFFASPREGVSMEFCLKRREPTQIKQLDGSSKMGWTPEASDQELERALDRLLEDGKTVWLNVEETLRDQDLDLLHERKDLRALISGGTLTVETAKTIQEKLPKNRSWGIALENEAMLLSGQQWMGPGLDAMVIGSSYLSEASQMYDQMGLMRYQAMLRGLMKKAAEKKIKVFSSGSYCTFEPTGKGDKNIDFVKGQIDFLLGRDGAGGITRYYKHVSASQDLWKRREEAQG